MPNCCTTDAAAFAAETPPKYSGADFSRLLAGAADAEPPDAPDLAADALALAAAIALAFATAFALAAAMAFAFANAAAPACDFGSPPTLRFLLAVLVSNASSAGFAACAEPAAAGLLTELSTS